MAVNRNRDDDVPDGRCGSAGRHRYSAPSTRRRAAAGPACEEPMLTIPHHGRYDYSAIVKRPNYSWPDGKRLALYVAVNIEHFAYGPGLGHAVSSELPHPDPRTFAWRDYGNRVGVWRLLDLLDELGLPGCHLVNTSVF